MSVGENWSKVVAEALNELYKDRGVLFSSDQVVVENPPRPELGDFAFPLFPYAKLLKISPMQIAQTLKAWFDEKGSGCRAEAVGPYLNLFVEMGDFASSVVPLVLNLGDRYGYNDLNKGKKIMIEFSCPNTNKPLHLGHLRNDALGESVSRILKATGAEVQKVNLINNRGIHICKSMLAYQQFGNGTTPESEGIKGDHFVGNYYVKYDQWAKTDSQAEIRAREMLVKWEAGDPETIALWEKMNEWTISGIEATYKDTGISFDRVYYESETYQSGKAEVLKGLEQGIFYKDEEGTVWVDLADILLDKKVLLRKDGTTLYLTQDLGTAIARQKDFPFDSLIYVVASEQQYHFKVLFHVLEKLGYQWADQLYHLSYGMVNLPEGKMKSREGTVVDADDLFEELVSLSKNEIIAKGREDEVGDVDQVAKSVALGALNYYLLANSPSKDMIFNPKETISFQGSTGPYTQYMGARISSLIRKYQALEEQQPELKEVTFDGSLLIEEEERLMIKMAADFPKTVELAGYDKNPSLIISFLYDLCKTFSRYYHDNPILTEENLVLMKTRITLCKVVLQLIQNCFQLTGIPFLDRM